jgi:hypothetical protein
VDDHRVLALEVQYADLDMDPSLAGPISIVRVSSMLTIRVALRRACHMSASATWCRRRVADPHQTTYLVVVSP